MDKAQTHEETGGHGDSLYTPNFLTRGKGGGIKLTYSRLEQRDEIQTRQTDRQTE